MYVGCMDAKTARVPIYNIRQMLRSKSVALSKIGGVASKGVNNPVARMNKTLFVITPAH